ncbi:MAG: phosphoribosylglycinamide formyltransferase [Planctomycetaceae bacterium]
MSPVLSIAVLISGGGTTLTNLLQRIDAKELRANVCLVLASRECTGVEKSQRAGLPTRVLPQKEYRDTASYSEAVFRCCREAGVDYVVLGGFLTRLAIPADFINRVINIHPSLIPAFCGEGMFGHHVHEAALARGVKVSGCTVHFCDGEYDHGPIILQRTVPVLDDDTADSLQQRVFAAECEALPAALQLIATGLFRVEGTHVRLKSDSRDITVPAESPVEPAIR